MDLKHLLVEAGQQLPDFLKQLAGEEDTGTSDKYENDEDKGCAYCSGLGHRITNCPKLESIRTKVGGRNSFPVCFSHIFFYRLPQIFYARICQLKKAYEWWRFFYSIKQIILLFTWVYI